MMRFQGKNVLVTGAAAGIGLATARAFAREGAAVHLVDRDRPRLEEAASALAASGATVHAHVVDCADGSAVEELAREVFARSGRLDVLHNNAGICIGGPSWEIPVEEWRRIVDINLFGVVHAVRAFVPRLIAQGGGAHIVNTASMAGLVGLPLVAPYCATKFAIVGLSESLAAELAPHGIRVTAVCPGAVRTGLMRASNLRLPGRWPERLEKALSSYGASPDRIALSILDAAQGAGGLSTPASEMLPLWLFKRLSANLYVGAARAATRLALRL
jgi:NAD(P)-dependent dehydrogenase (short-subunit alcohol dehydrogenase family)